MTFPIFPDIPDWVGAILQLILWAGVVYYYIQNKKKKVVVDPERIEYSTAVGMGSIAIIIVAMALIAMIYGHDTDGMCRAINSMKWISWILLVIGFSYVEYRFWKKKKRRANEPEIKNQDSL